MASPCSPHSLRSDDSWDQSNNSSKAQGRRTTCEDQEDSPDADPEFDDDEEDEDKEDYPFRVPADYDSGYDTDPVDHFFKVNQWQHRLSQIQRSLANARSRANSITSIASEVQSDDSSGCPSSEPFGANAKGMVKRAGDQLKQASSVPGEYLKQASSVAGDQIKQRSEQVKKVVNRAGSAVKEVKEKYEEAGKTLRKRGSAITDQRKKIVGDFKRRNQSMKQTYKKQVADLKEQMNALILRTRSAKARQFRHMTCFTLFMLSAFISCFWVGAFPHTFHYFYTLKLVSLVSARALWYRLKGWHYYLYDLCYYSNMLVMVYVWVLPDSQWLFQACYGCSGVLLISVVLFRNSFVPHSLDRMTSLSVHMDPAVMLWALRWFGQERGGRFAIPDTYSVKPSLVIYALWMVGYYSNQFIINRKRIDRKGYATLYKQMAFSMGILKTLPKSWQTDGWGRIAFILGHMVLFAVGLPFVWFPFWLHSFLISAAITVAVKNGANFYITYFWKVYNDQITAFEKQMATAQAAADASGVDMMSPERTKGMGDEGAGGDVVLGE